MLHSTLIYNPLAGPTNLAATVEQVADFWRDRGWQMIIEPTRAAGHATQLARQAAAVGHQLVLAAGGDGTLGEVANGLARTHTVMAPLPIGTANSFARELLMPLPTLFNPQKLLQASRQLVQGSVQSMDLGYTQLTGGQGRYWLLWSGTGLDGYLVEVLEPRPKWSKKLGRLGYTLQGLFAALRAPRMWAHVEIDGQIIEDNFVLVVVSNCRLFAGGQVCLSPQAQLDDGLFEVWLYRGQGLFKAFAYLARTKLGTHHHHPDISMHQGRHIVVHSQPIMPCQSDGDRAGQTPLSCRLIPGALKLLVPSSAPADLFQRPGQELADIVANHA